jgi:prophage regulatory protein
MQQITSRLLRLSEVMARCGLGRTSVYKLIGEGRFPAPVKTLGARASRWVEGEVDAWIQARIAEARETAAA